MADHCAWSSFVLNPPAATAAVSAAEPLHLVRALTTMQLVSPARVVVVVVVLVVVPCPG